MVTNTESHSPWRDGLVLALVTAVSVVLLLITAQVTRPRIERNQNAGLMQQMDALLPPQQYDNDLLLDRISLAAPDLLGTPQPMRIHRARRNDSPVAVILIPPGVQGYGGPIQLMIGVSHDGTVLGVQVLAHRETPGIGDAFERTDWLQQFARKSLRDPPQGAWAVQRDGGYFDQFTGATITARAIVSMVRRSLEFYNSRRDRLFTLPSED